MEDTVYYISRNKEGDNSKVDHVANVAGAIAAGSQASSNAIGKHTFVAGANILFTGCEVKGGKIPGSFSKMLKGLDPAEVKTVALFSVIKGGSATAMAAAKAILDPKGVKICAEEFSCFEATAFKNKGCPTEDDFKKAREFGAMIKSKYRNSSSSSK
ncbi:MAG: hypothetical protein FWD78_01950 [Treponema sp.]|nr:hypothetical protein [Treponema sp.]